MRAQCVQGGRGGQKRSKSCVRNISMAPKEPRGMPVVTRIVLFLLKVNLAYNLKYHNQHFQT